MDQQQKLLEQILQRLQQRKTAQVAIDCQMEFQLQPAPSRELFYHYQQIRLQQVPIQLIYHLDHFAEDDWTQWLLTGLAYQVSFELSVAQQVIPFIPWRMLRDWPLRFSCQGRQLLIVPKRQITGRDIRQLPGNGILITSAGQQFTAAAKEALQQKELELVERVEETCIWDK